MKRQRQIVVYDGDARANHISILHQEFELIPAPSLELLSNLVISQPFHGVVLHYAVPSREQTVSIDKFKVSTAWPPIIVLADRWNWDAIRPCGQIDIDGLVSCEEKPEKKLAAISSAMKDDYHENDFLCIGALLYPFFSSSHHRR